MTIETLYLWAFVAIGSPFVLLFGAIILHDIYALFSGKEIWSKHIGGYTEVTNISPVLYKQNEH